jgi:hypothetical protein
MKSYSTVAAALLMTAVWLGPSLRTHAAQQPATQTDTAQKAVPPAAAAVPAGSQVNGATPSNPGKPAFYILAELTQSLNAKKLKPGDPIKAQVTQDVLSHGKIIIPVDSKLIGHVTEAMSHGTEDPESRLGIVFDKVLLRRPREVDFVAVLQRLEPPSELKSRVDQPSQMLAPGGMGGGGAMGPVPMSTGMNPGPTRGSGSAPTYTSAANPAGSPTFLPPPSPSDPPSKVQKGTGPVASVEQQQAMSTGMPLGVYGIKGLSLIPGPSASTPGPVILSRGDIKLDNGTQILLRVTEVTVPQP